MNDAASIDAELEHAGTVIDACGEGARRGEAVDLTGLDVKVEALCQAVAGLPEAERAPFKRRLIDLMDRLNKLVATLETQRAAISDDIRGLTSRHRAVSAYGKGAGTSAPPGRGGKR